MTSPGRASGSSASAPEGLGSFGRDPATFASFLDRETVLQEATTILIREHGFDCAWLAEQTDVDAVTIRYESGMISRAAHDLKLRRGCGLGGKVFASSKVQWTDDYFTSSEITHQYDDVVRREKVRRIIGAPVYAGGTLVGVVLGGARDGATFGGQAATTIERLAWRVGDALVAAHAVRTMVAAVLYDERARAANRLHGTTGAALIAIAAGIRSVAESSTQPCVRARLAALESRTKAAATALRESVGTLQSPDEQLALRSVVRQAFDERSAAPEGPHALVRPREYQILCRVASGETNREIAEAIGLSENTVKSYLRNVMQRLDVRNRMEAIARAREVGLLLTGSLKAP